MGEYAIRKSDGAEVKIGTCEDMYYIRYDQRTLVTALRNNVDPVEDSGLRFRFPFPDEDGIQPGGFENHDRALTLSVKPLPGLDHYGTHREGPVGDTSGICQQKVVNGKLVTICKCACGSLFRLETLEDAQPWLDELAKLAQTNREGPDGFYTTVASRLTLGYEFPKASSRAKKTV